MTRKARLFKLHLIRYNLFERLDAGKRDFTLDYLYARDLIERAKRIEGLIRARAPRLPA
jgi:hypothetical protein